MAGVQPAVRQTGSAVLSCLTGLPRHRHAGGPGPETPPAAAAASTAAPNTMESQCFARKSKSEVT